MEGGLAADTEMAGVPGAETEMLGPETTTLGPNTSLSLS